MAEENHNKQAGQREASSTGPAGEEANKTVTPADELAYYNALDPSAHASDAPWEFEATSASLRKLAIIVAVVILIIHIFMSAVVGVGYTGAAVTFIDKFAFAGVGVILATVAYLGLSRPRVRVNSEGVEVRNFLGTRFYYWNVVYGLAFPRGSRMARLELPDFEYVPMWAMQSQDTDTILDDVSRFRALEARYMPED